MKKVLDDNFIIKLMVANNSLFILLFLLLSFYNRIAIDDFYFLDNVRKYGIIQGTIIEHQTWSGRWISVLLNQLVLSFYHFKYFLFVYEICALLLFIFSLNRLIKYYIISFKLERIESWKILNGSIFIISAIFYSTIKIDETWFWLCSSCTYLICVIMFFLGLSSILSPQKNVTEIALNIFSFCYVGGSCEPFALFVLLIMSVFWMLIFKDIIKLPLPKKNTLIKTAIAIASCSLSFLILYIANGNTIRRQFFDDISILETSVLNIKTTGMIVLLRLPAILPFVFLFTLPIIYTGNSKSKTLHAVIKNCLLTMLMYLFILYLYQFPITYITQDIAAYRALFPISFITLCASAIILYQLTYLTTKLKLYYKHIAIASFILIGIFQIHLFISQMNVLPKYAKAYDDRMMYLNKNINTNHVITLDSLPSSGLLYSAEITGDSLHFSNKHLQRGLGIKSGLILKQ